MLPRARLRVDTMVAVDNGKSWNAKIGLARPLVLLSTIHLLVILQVDQVLNMLLAFVRAVRRKMLVLRRGSVLSYMINSN
jgi:hypothetical protein